MFKLLVVASVIIAVAISSAFFCLALKTMGSVGAGEDNGVAAFCMLVISIITFTIFYGCLMPVQIVKNVVLKNDTTSVYEYVEIDEPEKDLVNVNGETKFVLNSHHSKSNIIHNNTLEDGKYYYEVHYYNGPHKIFDGCKKTTVVKICPDGCDKPECWAQQ